MIEDQTQKLLEMQKKNYESVRLAALRASKHESRQQMINFGVSFFTKWYTYSLLAGMLSD